jgi:hypothetical protein
MALFDDSDGSAARSQTVSHDASELPKIIISSKSDGPPSLTVSSQPQYRYTKEEQHPLTNRAETILPPKYKGDLTFDPLRIFEPSSLKIEVVNDKPATQNNPQQFTHLHSEEAQKDPANFLNLPERSMFGGGSSGGSSGLKGPDISAQKSLVDLFEPSRPRSSGENSIFIIIIASFAVLLGSLLKFLGRLFSPWMRGGQNHRRRVRFSRR